MTDAELLDLVRQMRAAQRQWFKFKMMADLAQAKRLEAQVDKALAARFNPQQGALL